MRNRQSKRIVNLTVKTLAAALLCALLAGCGTTRPNPAPVAVPSPSPTASSAIPKLGVSNGTTLIVTLVVNGQRVGDFPPDGPGPTIDIAVLPPLPWNVEARSLSGRVLTFMQVAPGEIQSADSAVHTIPMGRVDLSCGRLTIWAGDFPPSGPVPLPSAGSPGDCAP
jgi:hypothetical protein